MAKLFDASGSGRAVDPFDVSRYRPDPGPLLELPSAARGRDWDPFDDTDLDLATPFHVVDRAVMPLDWFPELRTPTARGLDDKARVRLGNEVARWLLSGILHGEQAAVHVAAQLCDRFTDPAAQAFAANQAREETRHVAAFSRYLHARWGPPYPVGEAFGRFLRHLVDTERIERKIVGIGVIVEGFAMGAFANIHAHTQDPALKSMMRALMREEAAHHNFALLWVDEALAQADDEARHDLGEWAATGFQAMLLNLLSLRQRRAAIEAAGVDWQRLRDEVREQRRAGRSPVGLQEDINPLAILARAMERFGLCSAWTRRAMDRLVPDRRKRMSDLVTT